MTYAAYAAKGFVKFFAANAAVILTIVLLPAFLVTGNIPAFEGVMDFLFSTKS